MGFAESVPVKNQLPNGSPAPVLCRTCMKELKQCVCKQPSQPTSVEDVIEKEDAALEQKAEARDAIRDIYSLHCKDCGYKGSECICPDTVAHDESEIRFHTPIPERIQRMLEFCESLQECIERSAVEKTAYTKLVARGKALTQEHAILLSNKGKGVLTEQIMKKHQDEVNKWLTECDDYNAALCSHASDTFSTTSTTTTLKPVPPGEF